MFMRLIIGFLYINCPQLTKYRCAINKFRQIKIKLFKEKNIRQVVIVSKLFSNLKILDKVKNNKTECPGKNNSIVRRNTPGTTQRIEIQQIHTRR